MSLQSDPSVLLGPSHQLFGARCSGTSLSQRNHPDFFQRSESYRPTCSVNKIEHEWSPPHNTSPFQSEHLSEYLLNHPGLDQRAGALRSTALGYRQAPLTIRLDSSSFVSSPNPPPYPFIPAFKYLRFAERIYLLSMDSLPVSDGSDISSPPNLAVERVRSQRSRNMISLLRSY